MVVNEGTFAKLKETAADAIVERNELREENAKLRGLVRYAYECAIHSCHATCDDCRRMNSRCILADAHARARNRGELDGQVYCI